MLQKVVAMVMNRGRWYDTTDRSWPRIAAIWVAQAATPKVPQPCSGRGGEWGGAGMADWTGGIARHLVCAWRGVRGRSDGRWLCGWEAAWSDCGVHNLAENGLLRAWWSGWGLCISSVSIFGQQGVGEER